MEYFSKTDQKEPDDRQPGAFTPEKGSFEESSSEEVQHECMGEESGLSKLWQSIAGICAKTDNVQDEPWCKMKEGMAEI
eukprot:scaffold692_cov118-Cylindrotheca_fusiformis.AAC.20